MKILIKGISDTKRMIDREFLKLQTEAFEKQVTSIIDDLANATPIDTGFARSRWQRTPIVTIQYKGNIRRSLQTEIYNDTAYIDSLNQGSSEQAAPFFVERILIQHGQPVAPVVNYVSSNVTAP